MIRLSCLNDHSRVFVHVLLSPVSILHNLYTYICASYPIYCRNGIRNNIQYRPNPHVCRWRSNWRETKSSRKITTLWKLRRALLACGVPTLSYTYIPRYIKLPTYLQTYYYLLLSIRSTIFTRIWIQTKYKGRHIIKRWRIRVSESSETISYRCPPLGQVGDRHTVTVLAANTKSLGGCVSRRDARPYGDFEFWLGDEGNCTTEGKWPHTAQAPCPNALCMRDRRRSNGAIS